MTQTAVRFHGPGDLRVDQVPTPEVKPGTALLRVEAVGICATDQKIAARGHFKIPAGSGPRTLGHEVTGAIVEVGAGVRDLAAGSRVVVAPNLGCGTCPECVQGDMHLCENYDALGITLDGGMAEYMLIPALMIARGNVLPVPAHLDPAHAALVEPLACCYNALEACRLKPGHALLIIGAGPMGLMHAALGLACGATPVIVSDLLEARLERALSIGADAAIKADVEDVGERVLESTGGRGADVVIVAAASARAQSEAAAMAARRGSVNFFASLPGADDQVTVPANLVHYRQISITGTTGANVTHFREVLKLLGGRRLEVTSLVTSLRPLADAKEAFEQARAPEHARVVLESATKAA